MRFVLPPQSSSELDFLPTLKDPYRASVALAEAPAAKVSVKSMKELHDFERNPLKKAFSLLLGFSSGLLQVRKSLLSRHSLNDVPQERLQQWVHFQCMRSFYTRLEKDLLAAEKALGISSISFHLIQEFHSGDLTWPRLNHQLDELFRKVPGVSMERGYPQILELMDLLNSMFTFQKSLPSLETQLRTSQDSDGGLRTLNLDSLKRLVQDAIQRAPTRLETKELRSFVVQDLSSRHSAEPEFKKVVGFAFDVQTAPPGKLSEATRRYEKAVGDFHRKR